jgi:hypothetical protein
MEFRAGGFVRKLQEFCVVYLIFQAVYLNPARE